MRIAISGPEYIENLAGTEITRQNFRVEMNGEVRVVKAMKGGTDYGDGETRYFLAPEFRANVGRSGKKAHRTGVTVDVKGDGTIVVYNTVVLNRQAQVTGFWQNCYDAPQGYGSKHVGTFRG